MKAKTYIVANYALIIAFASRNSAKQNLAELIKTLELVEVLETTHMTTIIPKNLIKG